MQGQGSLSELRRSLALKSSSLAGILCVHTEAVPLLGT